MGGKPKDKFYSIRIPENLKRRAKSEAKKLGISFNEYVVKAVESRVETTSEKKKNEQND